MILTVLIFFGVVLVLALVYRAVSRSQREGEMGEAQDAEKPRAMEAQLPPRMLVEQIFSRQDADYAGRQSLTIQKKYQRERKRIAILWLRELRGAVGHEMHDYRIVARASADVSVAIEIKMAMNYAGFLVMWMAACALVWLKGPAAAQALASNVYDTAEGLFLAAGKLLQPKDVEAEQKIGTAV